MSGDYRAEAVTPPCILSPAGCWETASAPSGAEGIGYRAALQAAGWEPFGVEPGVMWFRRVRP